MALALLCASAAGCAEHESVPGDAALVREREAKSVHKRDAPSEPLPPELLRPIELWRDGRPAGHVDAQGPDADQYVFLDLGEPWTPVLFADGKTPTGESVPHKFRDTYLALARGEFPKDAYGERAQDDKYLELYGIMPTLAVLRARLSWARELSCSKQLDLTALESFDGVVTFQGPSEASRQHKRFVAAQQAVERWKREQRVDDPRLLRFDALKGKGRRKAKPKDQAQLAWYLAHLDDDLAIRAAQARLQCEGYFKDKGKWTWGAFDWATHKALAEFERRHRVYSWGALGAATVAALRVDTATSEHETVLRVLEERAMHAFGAIEDGSAKRTDGTPITFVGADGQTHQVANLQSELRTAVVRAFGLSDPERTFAFLQGLGTLDRDAHRYVAIPAPPRPEYYARDMELSVTIDRGDVWYEFPYDEAGAERAQGVSRRPHHYIFTHYRGQKILLASYGTTIGGWKSEQIDGSVWWKYKESPAGEVLWKDILSAPVWLPPDSTPPRELLKRRQKRKPGQPKWEPNYHETGPSYASAYGLVAAYHRKYEKLPDGELRIAGDDGIRSHGSVDYMSILRRHSHGCHRLHNHIAVRLFSFIINHRPHARTGHQPTAFVMDIEYEEEQHKIEIRRGGYVFRLDKPILVTVLEGRIKGKVRRAIQTAIPKFNSICKAYYLPDGSTVIPQPDGKLVPSTRPVDCDPGLPPVAPTPLATADYTTAWQGVRR